MIKKCHFPTLGMLAVAAATVLIGNPAWGQPSGARPYIVQSSDAGLRRTLGVRHDFGKKFTVRLNPRQVAALARQGIATDPVRLFYPIAPPGKCAPWPECKNGGGGDGGGGTVERIATPNDPTPWGIEKIYGDPGIQATSGGAGVNVAVLDTGVNANHIDLQRRVAQCVNFTGGPPGALRIREGSCADKNGHGTHVAGTILADGGADGLGIYGVAPAASLLAYKVCGGSGCWGDDIAAAIDYAGTHGAHIVSMSLGGDAESSLIRDAIQRNLHLLFVAAAGNDGPAVGSIDYPGGNPNVVAVGAIDVFENVPNWSSRGVNNTDGVIGAREVEFGAPGVVVESTSNDGGYEEKSGTSMATPHVSGMAAKFWQPEGAVATRAFLQGLARDIWDGGEDKATGLGLPVVSAAPAN